MKIEFAAAKLPGISNSTAPLCNKDFVTPLLSFTNANCLLKCKWIFPQDR